MDLKIQGRRALVTGGSRGIGKAIARQLAHEGCDVAICARSEGPLQETAHELAKETGRRVIGISCDTTDAESIKRFVTSAAADLGGVEILVNSAARLGGTIPDDFETIPDEQILRDFEEKSVGYFRCVRAAAPFMKQAGWGRVVNIAGLSGRTPGTGISTGARNAAVVYMTKAMSNALGPFGINVNVVYPGATLTEYQIDNMRAQAERQGKGLEELMKERAERTLIKHLITAEDVANVVVFLCSPLAVSITGEAISVGGGTGADVHH